MHALRALAIACLAVIGCTQPSAAQQTTFIVAFSAGGVADAIARIIAQRLSDKFGQKTVVENRPGAGGNIAAKLVTGSNPDGLTVLVTTTSLAVNDTASRNKGYSTDELRTVAIPASSPDAIATHPSNPAKDLGELVRNAKASGKEVNFGTAGVGTSPYIAAAYFFQEVAKIKATHVPFPGGAPAMAAVAGGHVELYAGAVPTAVPLIVDGSLRGLGLASPVRISSVPNVPTYAEAGFPNFYAATWVGFFVPAKTPDAAVAKLNAQINEILSEPEAQQKLKSTGFDAIIKNHNEASEYFKSEVATWGRMSRAIGFTMN